MELSKVTLDRPRPIMISSRGLPKRYNSGAPRSVARLKELGFDPISSLIDVYKKIEAEISIQERLRDNTLVQLNGAGKQRAYRPEVHHALYDKLAKIGTDLLRYKYGRVPEVEENSAKALPALLVQLTGVGDVYTIGDPDPDFGEEDDAS